MIIKKLVTFFIANLIMINFSFANINNNPLLEFNLNEISTRGGVKVGNYSFFNNHIENQSKTFPLNTLNAIGKINDGSKETRGSSGESIFSKYARSVVLVFNEDKKTTGSGSIINVGKGHIITNWHVIDGGSKFSVVIKNGAKIKQSDVYKTKLLAYDKRKDLALLEVIGKLPSGIVSIKLSDDFPNIGSDVHAIGHPISLSWSYTKGYVSQVRESYNWKYEKSEHQASVIQTQTPISPGNSGGPLLNEDGIMLGVNSFGIDGENLNFAISSTEVKSFVKNVKFPSKSESKYKKKKTNKVVKKIDSNNDGIIDTLVFDMDGDGYPETVVADDNQNGIPEIAGVDNNKDGKIDYTSQDIDEDGKVDIWHIDEDYDGNMDFSGIDTNNDGKPDKFKKI
jgi:S1-C subfamily serine protease